MTDQSSPLSLENVAADSLSSTNLGEVRQNDTDHGLNTQVGAKSPAVEYEQGCSLPALPMHIHTAFQTLQNHIDGLHTLPDTEVEIASLSEGLNSIRQRALKLCQSIPTANDHQTNPEPIYESSVETSPEHFTVYNDAGSDHSGSEDCHTLVDPSHQMISHSFSRKSDNKENESFDATALPDWACTVTAGGCRVPLFWEGGDMGYFEYQQEQMEGGQGIC
jgi:hypothetical protein